MKNLVQGLQQKSSSVFASSSAPVAATKTPTRTATMVNRCNLLMCILLISNSVLVIYGKSLEQHHQHLHEKIVRKRNVAESPSCDLVQHFFESMNISVSPHHSQQQINHKANGECRNFVLICLFVCLFLFTLCVSPIFNSIPIHSYRFEPLFIMLRSLCEAVCL